MTDGPRIGSTLEAQMVDSQDALLSFIVMGAVATGTVVGGFWLAVFWMRSLGRKVGYSLAPLGFSRPRGGFLAGIGVGMAVGVGAVLLSMIVNPISIFVLERLGYSTESTVQQPFMEGLVGWVQESPGMAIPAIVLVVVLFGPAVEELVFRGVVFNGLYRLGTLIYTRSVGADYSEGSSSIMIFIIVRPLRPAAPGTGTATRSLDPRDNLVRALPADG